MPPSDSDLPLAGSRDDKNIGDLSKYIRNLASNFHSIAKSLDAAATSIASGGTDVPPPSEVNKALEALERVGSVIYGANYANNLNAIISRFKKFVASDSRLHLVNPDLLFGVDRMNPDKINERSVNAYNKFVSMYNAKASEANSKLRENGRAEVYKTKSPINDLNAFSKSVISKEVERRTIDKSDDDVSQQRTEQGGEVSQTVAPPNVPEGRPSTSRPTSSTTAPVRPRGEAGGKREYAAATIVRLATKLSQALEMYVASINQHIKKSQTQLEKLVKARLTYNSQIKDIRKEIERSVDEGQKARLSSMIDEVQAKIDNTYTGRNGTNEVQEKIEKFKFLRNQCNADLRQLSAIISSVSSRTGEVLTDSSPEVAALNDIKNKYSEALGDAGSELKEFDVTRERSTDRPSGDSTRGMTVQPEAVGVETQQPAEPSEAEPQKSESIGDHSGSPTGGEPAQGQPSTVNIGDRERRVLSPTYDLADRKGALEALVNINKELSKNPVYTKTYGPLFSNLYYAVMNGERDLYEKIPKVKDAFKYMIDNHKRLWSRLSGDANRLVDSLKPLVASDDNEDRGLIDKIKRFFSPSNILSIGENAEPEPWEKPERVFHSSVKPNKAYSIDDIASAVSKYIKKLKKDGYEDIDIKMSVLKSFGPAIMSAAFDKPKVVTSGMGVDNDILSVVNWNRREATIEGIDKDNNLVVMVDLGSGSGRRSVTLTGEIDIHSISR